jgi:hypothetical protein
MQRPQSERVCARDCLLQQPTAVEEMRWPLEGDVVVLRILWNRTLVEVCCPVEVAAANGAREVAAASEAAAVAELLGPQPVEPIRNSINIIFEKVKSKNSKIREN